ncbi:MAG: deoxyribonuclease V [Planctomycetes bacterium]|nr:deoxyribonuclease V [Planctomycetota bacterium]
MHFKKLHRWDVSYARARELQEELRSRLILRAPRRKFRLVAGTDISYSKKSDQFFGGVIVLSLPDLEEVDRATAVGRVTFPYIPGLLSFREAPVLLKAFGQLRTTPDLVLFDGQGTAHPRGIGLASHLGLVIDLPSIGCAKSRLCGEHGDVGPRAGSHVPLKLDGKTIGAVVRTRDNVNPIFVSPGHRMGVRSSVTWALRCCAGYRIPEPTRRAHHLVNELRMKKT